MPLFLFRSFHVGSYSPILQVISVLHPEHCQQRSLAATPAIPLYLSQISFMEIEFFGTPAGHFYDLRLAFNL
jgi:hypothetical protein